MTQSRKVNGNYEERAALYYPYIHIRSENWLKSAILAFQKVNRIVPFLFTLADDEIIHPYSVLTGPDKPFDTTDVPVLPVSVALAVFPVPLLAVTWLVVLL